MGACAALLGYTVAEGDGGWKDIQEMMRDCEELRDKMLALEAVAVTAEQWAFVKGIAEQPEFTYESQKMASMYGAWVTAWVLALLSLRDPDGTLEDARLFLRTMKLQDMKEVRAFGKPPPRLLLSMGACAALLGYTVAEGDGGWKDIQEMMRDCEELRDKMLALEAVAVTAEQWALAK